MNTISLVLMVPNTTNQATNEQTNKPNSKHSLDRLAYAHILGTHYLRSVGRDPETVKLFIFVARLQDHSCGVMLDSVDSVLVAVVV